MSLKKELKTEYSEMPWFKKLFVESYRKRLAAIDDYCIEWLETFNDEMYLANQLDAALKDALDETLKVDIKAIYMLRNVIELTEHMVEKENNAINS